MRLGTYSVDGGAPRLGADCGRAVLDLDRYSHLHDGLRLPADMLELLAAGPSAWQHAAELCERFLAELSTHDLAQDAEAGLAYARDRVRWHAPIPRPRKNVFCLGQNYAAHAAESGNAPPTAPIYFTKPPTTVSGRMTSAYWKLRRRPSFDFPILGVAIAITWDEGVVRQARGALGAVGSHPVDITPYLAPLTGARPGEDLIVGVAEAADKPSRPLDNTDLSHYWRKRMTKVYIERALREACGLPPLEGRLSAQVKAGAS